MSWSGVDLNCPLERAVFYRIRLTYLGKDKNVFAERLGLFPSRWNSKYKGRFDARTAKVSGELAEITGYGVKSETMGALNFPKFCSAHLHVEGTAYYDLALDVVAPPGGPGVSPPGSGPVTGTPGAGTPPAKPGPSMLTIGLVVVVVLALVVGGVMVLGKSKGRGGSPSPITGTP